jgi:hypothetical protein
VRPSATWRVSAAGGRFRGNAMAGGPSWPAWSAQGGAASLQQRPRQRRRRNVPAGSRPLEPPRQTAADPGPRPRLGDLAVGAGEPLLVGGHRPGARPARSVAGWRSGSAPGPWHTTAARRRTGPGSPAGPQRPGHLTCSRAGAGGHLALSTTATARRSPSPSWPSPGGHRSRPAGPGTGTSPRPGARPARRSAPPAAPAATGSSTGDGAATSGRMARRGEDRARPIQIEHTFTTSARVRQNGKPDRGRLRG